MWVWRFCIEQVLRGGEEQRQHHASDDSICSEEGRANVKQADVIIFMYICIYKPTSFG